MVLDKCRLYFFFFLKSGASDDWIAVPIGLPQPLHASHPGPRTVVDRYCPR